MGSWPNMHGENEKARHPLNIMKKKKMTIVEKHGRSGASISVTWEDDALLENLKKLLGLKTKPAVIRFLIERFRNDLINLTK